MDCFCKYDFTSILFDENNHVKHRGFHGVSVILDEYSQQVCEVEVFSWREDACKVRGATAGYRFATATASLMQLLFLRATVYTLHTQTLVQWDS